ncbi:MAG: FAD-dependent monooxygenase [Rhodothermales bacterium]|nr:FAD-dependent monooxygenase [Rhodothermales bacterium]MBO6780945.1 FAD-dependent monooxygenase [Rhodothermales bacterium]
MIDVAIVGGGPVGLDLANRLVQAHRTVRVLEKRAAIGTHSRSIGIHPPSLEMLRETGVTDELLARGVHIREGIAYVSGREAGRIDMRLLPPPFPFVLAIPQYVTEQVLQDRLPAECITRGVEVTALTQHQDRVVLQTPDGPVAARFVVGADGQHSTVRTLLGIPFRGGAYRDRYLMGDFSDTTDFGERAAIFLDPDGLTEAFPLPGKIRRWVVRLQDRDDAEADVHRLIHLVRQRTDHRPDPATNTMLSAFRVYRLLAERLNHGRVILAGDAAHVVSPIGGQGMNVGWLDGRHAAGILQQALDGADHRPLFEAYTRRRRRTARQAARRAEFNMAFGRPGPLAPFMRAGARAILWPPLARLAVQRFTMRGLT